MHYKNGREVKIGDRVVGVSCGMPKSGMVAATVPGSTACNIAVVPLPDYLSCSHQSKDFLHVDDVELATTLVDSSRPNPEPAE